YAFDSFSERKTVTAPFYSVLSNATTAASSTVQLMSDTRDTLNLMTAWERLSDQQRRSLFMTGGVLLGGLPVNAFYNWTEIVNNLYEGKGAAATAIGLGAAAILPMLKEETTQSIDAYIEEVETPAERYKRQ